MARVSYGGTQELKAFSDSLRPVEGAVIEARKRHRPFGPHYNVLAVITAEVDAAAEFVTGNRAFYSIGDSGAIGRKSDGGRDT